jgi:hypothetical protein
VLPVTDDIAADGRKFAAGLNVGEVRVFKGFVNRNGHGF